MREIQAVAKSKIGDFVFSHQSVPGRYVTHDVDIVVRNGRPLLAAQALSFAMSQRSTARNNVESAAFILEDVHRAGAVPISVVVGEPNRELSGEFERAIGMFEDMNVNVVRESGVRAWARHEAPRIVEGIKLELPA
jgi:hypothetical protein